MFDLDVFILICIDGLFFFSLGNKLGWVGIGVILGIGIGIIGGSMGVNGGGVCDGFGVVFCSVGGFIMGGIVIGGVKGSIGNICGVNRSGFFWGSGVVGKGKFGNKVLLIEGRGKIVGLVEGKFDSGMLVVFFFFSVFSWGLVILLGGWNKGLLVILGFCVIGGVVFVGLFWSIVCVFKFVGSVFFKGLVGFLSGRVLILVGLLRCIFLSFGFFFLVVLFVIRFEIGFVKILIGLLRLLFKLNKFFLCGFFKGFGMNFGFCFFLIILFLRRLNCFLNFFVLWIFVVVRWDFGVWVFSLWLWIFFFGFGMSDLVVCIFMFMWGCWNVLIGLIDDFWGWVVNIEFCWLFLVWVRYGWEVFWLFVCIKEVCGRFICVSCVLEFCWKVWMGCIEVCCCWGLLIFCKDCVGKICCFCWFFR